MRDNLERANRAILLIWFVLLAEMATLIAAILMILQYNGSLPELYILETDLTIYDVFELLVVLFYTIIMIMSVVAFLKWFRRAYFNLHQHCDYLYFTEGWAAGAWFIPLLNIFRPYRIMRELYIETSELIKTKQPNLIFVNLWWFLWITSNIIENTSFRIFMRADSLDQMMDSYKLDIFICILYIPLCLLVIKVIKDYSKIEQQFYLLKQVEKIGSGEDSVLNDKDGSY